jgi:hypothetical protein
MDIYEVWSTKDGREITYGLKTNLDSMREKGMMEDSQILLHSFESTDYNSAMNIVHELMGFEPYIPMKDEE